MRWLALRGRLPGLHLDDAAFGVGDVAGGDARTCRGREFGDLSDRRPAGRHDLTHRSLDRIDRKRDVSQSRSVDGWGNAQRDRFILEDLKRRAVLTRRTRPVPASLVRRDSCACSVRLQSLRNPLKSELASGA